MRRLPDLYSLTRVASWLMPLVFLVSIESYFLRSLHSSRYGVQSIEWVIFTVMTTVVLIGTLVIILLPVTQKGMMEEVPLPPSMKRSEDMIRESLHLLFPFVQMKRSEDDTRTPASSI
uniref:Uncharacterized protein n=1 Tax=Oryza nivara TaxID=4536 RepID=A0A0E0I4B6_ORYNI